MKKILFLVTLMSASFSYAQPSIPVHGFLTGEGITDTENIVVSVCTSLEECAPNNANYCEVQSDIDVDEDGFFLIFIGEGEVGGHPCSPLTPFDLLSLGQSLSVGIRAGGENFGPFILGDVPNALAVGGIKPDAIQVKTRNEIQVSQGDDIFAIFNNVSPGTTIRLGAGIFSSTDVVTLPEDVSVVGAGRVQTEFRGGFVISGGRSGVSDMTIVPPNTQFALTVQSDALAPIVRSEAQIKNVAVRSRALSALLIEGDFSTEGASLEIADCDFELVSPSVESTIRFAGARGKVTLRDSFVTRKGTPTSPSIEVDATSFTGADKTKTLLVDDVHFTQSQSTSVAEIVTSAGALLIFKNISVESNANVFNLAGAGTVVLQHSRLPSTTINVNAGVARIVMSEVEDVIVAGGASAECVGSFGEAGSLLPDCAGPN